MNNRTLAILHIAVLSCFYIGGINSAFASNDAMQSFTLSGPVYQAGTTTPLLDSNLSIKIQILNPAKNCVLYEELQTYDTNATGGKFNIQVGSATGHSKRTANDPHNAMAQITQNITAIAGTGATCGGTYAPAAGAARYFRITFIPSATGVADVMAPDLAMGSVPSALVAQSLQGLERSDVLQVRNDSSYVLNQANLEDTFSNANYAKLTALLAGTTTQYLPASPVAPVNFNGQRLSNLANPTAAQDSATKLYADSYVGGKAADVSTVGAGFGNGKVLVWDQVQAKWVATALATGGTVTSITGGTGLLGGTITTAGSFSVDVGTTAGKIVQLNASAQLPAVDGSLLTNISSSKLGSRNVSATAPMAGQFLGWNATTSLWEPATSAGGGGGGITALTGDVTASGSGSVAATIAPNSIISSKINNVGVAINRLLITDAATGSTVSYATCAVGEILKYTASGWACAAMSGTGSVTSINTGAGLLGGPITTSGSLSVDVGVTALKIVQLNASAQLPAVDGSLLTNISSSKIGSRNVSSAAPSAGQVLGWNATTSQWEPIANSGGGGGFANGGNAFGGTASLGTTDSFALQLIAGNVTAMTVTPAGNVGIGTGSPNGILDLSATGPMSSLILPRDTTANRPVSAVNGMMRYNTSTAKVEAYQGGSWTSMSGGAAGANGQVQYNAAGVTAGNVGFVWDNTNQGLVVGGTGNATRRFEVAQFDTNVYSSAGVSASPASLTSIATIVRNTAATNGSGTYYEMSPQNSSGNVQNAYLGAVSTAGAGYSPSIVFGQRTGVASYSERLRIDPAGNVGIGTTSPGALLDVEPHLTSSSGTDYGFKLLPAIAASGTAGYTGLLVNVTPTTTGTGSGLLMDLQRNGSSQFSVDAFGSVTAFNGFTSGLGFIANSNNSYVYTPSSAAASAPSGSGLSIYNANSINGQMGGQIKFWGKNASATGQTAYIGGVTNASGFAESLVFGHQTGATAYAEVLRIDGSGNVGIGTASPMATLDVNGYAKLNVNSSQPVACDAAHSGSLALTSQFTMCACKGTSSAWVLTSDGTTACVW